MSFVTLTGSKGGSPEICIKIRFLSRRKQTHRNTNLLLCGEEIVASSTKNTKHRNKNCVCQTQRSLVLHKVPTVILNI